MYLQFGGSVTKKLMAALPYEGASTHAYIPSSSFFTSFNISVHLLFCRSSPKLILPYPKSPSLTFRPVRLLKSLLLLRSQIISGDTNGTSSMAHVNVMCSPLWTVTRSPLLSEACVMLPTPSVSLTSTPTEIEKKSL